MSEKTMVETVARAICKAGFHDWPDDTYNGKDQQRYWRQLAKAAIEAMAEAGLIGTEEEPLWCYGCGNRVSPAG